MGSPDKQKLGGDKDYLNEKLLRVILQTTSDGVCVIDRNGAIVLVNDKFYELWNIPGSAKKQIDSVKIIKSLTQKLMIDDPFGHYLESNLNKVKDLPDVLKLRDGTRLSFQAKEILEQKKIEFLVCMFSEISSVNQIKNNLEFHEKQLDMALKGADLGLWDWDIKANQIKINAQWISMLGFDPMKIGSTIDFEMFRSLMHPDDFEPTMEQFNYHAVNKTEFYQAEFRMKHQKGNWVWILAKGKVISWDEDTNPLQAMGTHLEITERKKSEIEIKQNELKFRELTELSPSGISIQRDGKYLFVNSAWEKITGYSKDDALRIGPQKIVYPDSFMKASKQVESLYTGEISILREPLQITTKDKKTKWIDTSMGVIDFDGEPATLAVFDDITDRRVAQQALKDSEEKFRKLTELSPVAICIQTTQKFLFVNKAWSVITGYNPSEAVEMGPLDIIHPDMVGEIKKRSEQRLKGSKVIPRYDLKVVTKTNEEKWMDVVVTNIDFEGENASLAVSTDITEIKRTREALKESEEKFKSLFNDNSSVMLLIDPEKGNIVDANQAACKYYKYSIEELISMNVNQINVLSDEEINTEMSLALNEQRNYFIFKHQLGNGEIKDVEVYSGRVSVHEKDLLYSIIHDITDRKKAEGALRKSEQELRILNAQKVKFFSIIAHDLRSPIGNFLQITEILKNDYKSMDAETLDVFFNSIYNLSDNTFKLLENLLIWTQSQLGKYRLEPQLISVKDIVQESVDMIEATAKTKEITVHVDAKKGLFVYADNNSILTVFRNLLTNSIKFTERGGDIYIQAKEIKGQKVNSRIVELSVGDTGIGIPAEKLGKIFNVDESFTTPGTEEEKGTGLGVILCKELIEKNMGQISAESEVGMGTTFRFTLPISPLY